VCWFTLAHNPQLGGMFGQPSRPPSWGQMMENVSLLKIFNQRISYRNETFTKTNFSLQLMQKEKSNLVNNPTWAIHVEVGEA
jgi:hypothetical protein